MPSIYGYTTCTIFERLIHLYNSENTDIDTIITNGFTSIKFTNFMNCIYYLYLIVSKKFGLCSNSVIQLDTRCGTDDDCQYGYKCSPYSMPFYEYILIY